MRQERENHNQITPIAVTNWRDIRKVFGIREKNRRHHIYLIGKTGTGKSTLIANMVISDMRQGYGLALIDPHGDLAETVLQYVPETRINDVIYFNAGDSAYPIPFNPLEKVSSEDRHLVVSGIISVFKKIWPEFWGPRLEHILRHSLFTLLEYPNSTLLHLPPLLTDPLFRKRVMAYLTDPYVRAFWENEFEKYSAWLRSEAIAPILNKVGQFLTNKPLRNIVGQPKNTFHIHEVMDQGKILIANLSKGRIGEDSAALLGAMMVTEIQLGALQRARLHEHSRRSFYLYVDEVHSFLTQSFTDILSEARKYGLSLTLAHQYISQIDEKIRAAIMGNVGTMISFRIGTEDASVLSKEFRPQVSEADLQSLPNHHIYLRLMVNGMTSEPFSAMTLPLPQSSSECTSEVVRLSRTHFARQRISAEREISIKHIDSSIKGTKQSSLL
jgi:hypothetical protein